MLEPTEANAAEMSSVASPTTAPPPVAASSAPTVADPASGASAAAVAAAAPAEVSVVTSGMRAEGATSTSTNNSTIEPAAGAHPEVDKSAGLYVMKDAMKEVIPESVQAAFSAVGNVADKTREAIANAVPENVTKAASAVGKGITTGASAAGRLIEQSGDALVNVIPDSLMSQELKSLIFTDFNNTLRSFLHTNVLAFPYIVAEAGLVGGIVLTLLFAIVCEHTTELFVYVKQSIPTHAKMFVYGEVPRSIWGNWYPTLNIFHGVIHLLSFVVFAGHNFQVITQIFVGNSGSDAYFWAMMILLFLTWPLLLIKDAKHFRPLATVANFSIFLAIILLIVAVSTEPPATKDEIDLWPKTQVAAPQTVTSGTVTKVTSIFYVDTSKQRWAVALGLLVYALSGIGSVITVERTMVERPGLYLRLLRIAFGVTLTVLLGFGVGGYFSSGRGTCAVYTLSLDDGPLKRAVSTVLFIASVCILPQQLFPCVEVIDRRFLGLKGQLPYWTLTPNLMRLGVCVLCMIFGYNVPFYGLICAFGGAFGCGLLQLMIPPAMHVTMMVRSAEEGAAKAALAAASNDATVASSTTGTDTVSLTAAPASDGAGQPAATGDNQRSKGEKVVAAAGVAATAVRDAAMNTAKNVISWQGRLLRAIPLMPTGDKLRTFKNLLIFSMGFFTFFVSTFFVVQDIMQKLHVISLNDPHAQDVHAGRKCY